MDPDNSLQDLVRCHICEDHVPSLHCATCDTHLCSDCEWEHISVESEKHKIVSFRMRRSYRKCPNHSTEICERYCEECNIPICIKCFSSKKHKRHNIIDFTTRRENKKEALQRYLQEQEQSLFEIEINAPVQKTKLQENTDKSVNLEAIKTHEEDLHRKIDSHNMKMKSEIKAKQIALQVKHTAILIKEEKKTRRLISDMTLRDAQYAQYLAEILPKLFKINPFLRW